LDLRTREKTNIGTDSKKLSVKGR